MIDEFILYKDWRIGPKFFISNRAKFFFVIFGDGPANTHICTEILHFLSKLQTHMSLLAPHV
ncbi:hypothetical protein Hanom_Chr09g00781211 [Helianthus anomalus]